ncbi:MAG: Rpn family recombination-promoting nuclease/putative transposase, partial [Planctomycetes bacterium]|nr:Rpn family recombination-promoting nuclease/putative transposase [Planctomycetota bacterium]
MLHDLYSKSVMEIPENAMSIAEHYGPPGLYDQIVPGSFKLEPGSFVDDDLKGSQTDVLYSARRKKKKTLVYFLIENSSNFQNLTLFRILKYKVRIWDRYIAEMAAKGQKVSKLPGIYVFVIYNGRKRIRGELRYSDVFDVEDQKLIEFLDDSKMILINLPKMDFSEIKGTPEISACFTLLKGHTFPDKIEAVDRALSHLRGIENERIISQAMKYAHDAINVSKPELRRIARK